MDSGNPTISVPIGPEIHFWRLKTLEVMLCLCNVHSGKLFIYCSLSGFSEIFLQFPSFSVVLNGPNGRDLSPYLGQNQIKRKWWSPSPPDFQGRNGGSGRQIRRSAPSGR